MRLTKELMKGALEIFDKNFPDEKNTPLYPFGYGLSYTTFNYGTIKITNSFDLDQKITVSVAITNIGKRKGKEVVQLYIRDKYASITRPVKELKGFELLELLPGEKKIVDFELTEKELGFYDNDGEWILEKGDFEIFIGGNSQTNNKITFELK